MSKRTQWPLVGDVVWVGAAVPVGGSLLQDVRWPAISRAAADVWRVAVDERGEQAARQLFDEVARGTPGRKKGKGLRPEADSELMATYERGIRLGIPKDRVIEMWRRQRIRCRAHTGQASKRLRRNSGA